MNRIIFSLILYVSLQFSPVQAGNPPNPPAFPGAEGFGSRASGGRGGEVYIVTNLNDSGPGSLRDGLENASGPLTVVFEVGGTIFLEDHLTVRDTEDLTIAGQTAPGDGILIRGGTLQFRECENLIVRHIRVRYGWEAEDDHDAISVSNTTNSIFDHLSASWGMDETFSLTNETSLVTVQKCLIAEGVKDGHQYGMLIDSRTPGGGKISLIGNLFINHEGRMPRANSATEPDVFLDMVNNVLYNWSTSGDWGLQGTALNPDSWANWNFRNNYSIAGRNTGSDFYRQTILRGGDGVDRFYIEGNRCDWNVDGVLDGVEAGWDFVRGNFTMMESPFAVPGWASVNVPLSATDTLFSIVEDAGATPLNRDPVDTRLIEELTSWGTRGFVVTRINYPEWPTLTGGEAPTDTDRDGIPDSWEETHGLNSNNPSDGPMIDEESGYSNLERYLNWLVRPTVSFQQDVFSVKEGEAAELRIRRAGYASEELTVGFRIEGDATLGVDFEDPPARTARFEEGKIETVLPIHTLLDDRPFEPNETVSILLEEGAEDYQLGEIRVTQVQIENVTPAGSLWRLR